MSHDFEIIVISGAGSSEREVSLRSGRAVSGVLPNAKLIELVDNVLPLWINGAQHIVFPVLHGGWGENGGVQAELEARGVAFAGCDSASSRLCMDKVATKHVMRKSQVPAIPEISFKGEAKPTAPELVSALGPRIVIKPANQGSSVGLFLPEGNDAICQALSEIPSTGFWMAERRLQGREMSIGILDGEPMGIVEIIPLTGAYDYQTKYSKGATEYRYPAALNLATTQAIGAAAALLFKACGCRDFARADVILEPDGNFYFLEINTLPGMTETSLMPKSATCVGLDFTALVQRMLAPAIARAHRKNGL